MEQMSTAAEITSQIHHTEWVLGTYLPNQFKGETHARRLASLKRQRTEAERNLSRLVTELGSKIQEGR